MHQHDSWWSKLSPESLDCCTDTAFIGWTPMEVFGGWASGRVRVNPSSLQPSSWACCFTPRASPDLAPTNVTYFTRGPDFDPAAYRLNILGRQSESNSHSFPDLLICNFFGSSLNSSYLQHICLIVTEKIVYNVHEFSCLRRILAFVFDLNVCITIS